MRVTSLTPRSKLLETGSIKAKFESTIGLLFQKVLAKIADQGNDQTATIL